MPVVRNIRILNLNFCKMRNILVLGVCVVLLLIDIFFGKTIIANIQNFRMLQTQEIIQTTQNFSYLMTQRYAALLKKDPQFTPSPITLHEIFDDHAWIATISGEHLRTVLATGDIIPARSVNMQSSVKNDYTWAFLQTYSLLSNADITFINLESPLIEKCDLTREGMIFCGNPNHVTGLKLAGVDIANLANNHSYNYGESGIQNTSNILTQNSIQVIGVKKPVIYEVRGLKFGFLGYNDVGTTPMYLSKADEGQIRADIEAIRNLVDIVVVSFHWGIEYQHQPSARQIQLAYQTIDNGADLIIGNHPHWIEPVEIYKGKLIMYAHGNFIFDQMWSEETKTGVIGKYTFYDKDLIDVEYFPIYIKDYGQPEFMTGEKADGVLKMLKEISIAL